MLQLNAYQELLIITVHSKYQGFETTRKLPFGLNAVPQDAVLETLVKVRSFNIDDICYLAVLHSNITFHFVFKEWYQCNPSTNFG